MKRYILILSALILTFLGGCTKYEDIEIKNVEFSSFEFKSTKEAIVSFVVTVDNPTKRRVALSDFKGDLFKSGSHFAEIILSEKVWVDAKTVQSVPVNATVYLKDPLALLASGLDIDKWSPKDFYITGRAVLANDRGLKKKFDFKEVTFDQIMNKIQ